LIQGGQDREIEPASQGGLADEQQRQRGLQDVLRQPVQQPVRADQLDSLLFGLGQELLR
jgi:hypothetical protein